MAMHLGCYYSYAADLVGREQIAAGSVVLHSKAVVQVDSAHLAVAVVRWFLVAADDLGLPPVPSLVCAAVGIVHGAEGRSVGTAEDAVALVDMASASHRPWIFVAASLEQRVAEQVERTAFRAAWAGVARKGRRTVVAHRERRRRIHWLCHLVSA